MLENEKQVWRTLYGSNRQTLLNYGPTAKYSQLTAAMFYKDKAGKMDVANPAAADATTALHKRYKFSQESKPIEIPGQIF
jgi:hypothetical protein